MDCRAPHAQARGGWSRTVRRQTAAPPFTSSRVGVVSPPATQVGQAANRRPEKRGRRVPRTLVRGETESELGCRWSRKWTRRPWTGRRSRPPRPTRTRAGEIRLPPVRRRTRQPRTARRSGPPRPTRPRAGGVEVAAGYEGVPDSRGRQAKEMPPRPARPRTGLWNVVPGHGEGGRATADELEEETPRRARFRAGTRGGPRP